MAAHIITALSQLEKENPIIWEFLDHSLNYACWTEDLDFQDWGDLRFIVDSRDSVALRAWIQSMHQKYYPVWENYGFPRTREEWNLAWMNA